MENDNKILTEFYELKTKYTLFADLSYRLVQSLLKSYGINVHQLVFRVKDEKSLEGKLKRKGDKYSSIFQITDIVGLRVITYFEDDIDKVSKLIENEFDIDISNSIDKRQLDLDKFGYRSLHYVLGIKKERLQLTEYKAYENFKFEIQIRSILQHSWAEIEHDLGYKGAVEIPNTAKRTFYRVAALLEQADIEFVKLREEILMYENSVSEQIKVTPSTVLLNKASLRSLIENSTIINNFEKKMGLQLSPATEENFDFIIKNSLPKLESLRIQSVEQLESEFKKHEHDLTEYVIITKKAVKGLSNTNSPTSFLKGASIIWLANVLMNKNKKLEV
ncbi:hypothetical protein GCM10011514_41050 [Emticicia aquatilis]|uniref:RelA/SpoT domain-containing protein n=1 Tax=Emticicia aquatilis TaxID=1537369 RepID=A0A917DW11_9BACT|nr:(p)ppGpp synthetase [Emticicia aquatilis]GGD72753.1 hypothetical protein GCM10011514_41050 [Emticicia aquatilis]